MSYETLDPEIKAQVTVCRCGHDSESHVDTIKALGSRCGCCFSTTEQPDTLYHTKRPLVVFRYIKGRAGHFSGSVHL